VESFVGLFSGFVTLYSSFSWGPIILYLTHMSDSDSSSVSTCPACSAVSYFDYFPFEPDWLYTVQQHWLSPPFYFRVVL